MTHDRSHGFPKMMFDDVIKNGTIYKKDPSKNYLEYRKKGTHNGRDGVFEVGV